MLLTQLHQDLTFAPRKIGNVPVLQIRRCSTGHVPISPSHMSLQDGLLRATFSATSWTNAQPALGSIFNTSDDPGHLDPVAGLHTVTFRAGVNSLAVCKVTLPDAGRAPICIPHLSDNPTAANEICRCLKHV